jgi:twitching motility protein PilT
VELTLTDILEAALDKGASDIHVVVGHPPMARTFTHLTHMDEYPMIGPEDSARMVETCVGPEQFARLQKERDLDFATSLPGRARFRGNAHYQRGAISIALRTVTRQIPRLAELNLPAIVEEFTDMPRGLVLVTGPTGSGKSTTLASMIHEMNRRHNRHVITIEDPIEYTLQSRTCLIEQRELGSDVVSFAGGLRHALRQDPDVILVGEMRDLETTSAALTAAETGHLVLSTLHTSSAAQTVERIIDLYPSVQQNQVRSMLSNSLQAVITQNLFRRADGLGMAPACEVMICNAAVRNCVRENRIHEINPQRMDHRSRRPGPGGPPEGLGQSIARARIGTGLCLDSNTKSRPPTVRSPQAW